MKFAVAAALMVLGFEVVLASPKIVCYFSSWAHYRNGNGRLSSEDIDSRVCTHLIYAFAGLNNDYTVHTLDSWLSEDNGLGDYRKFTGLKRTNANLKTLIGIGGWNEDVARLSRMASTARNRQTFIQSVLDFIQDFGFDGLNLDWQYPANRGGLPSDKRNFIELLKELRQAFDKHGYVLGSSAAANLEIINTAYDIPQVTKYVDYVSFLTYDYHGSWDTKTGHNAPLYPRKNENAVDRNLNVDATVSLWLKKGADASKILLGIPAYGRTFTLRSANRNRVGDPTIGPGPPGPHTQQGGYLGYNEIVEMFEYEDGWTVEFDDEQKVPFAYKDTFWISFENIQSAGIKAEYIQQKGFGGAMFWSLETEDFHGTSGVGSNPLVNTVKTYLFDGITVTTPVSKGTSKTTKASPKPTILPTNECVKEGTIPHSSDCTKYITCIKVGRDGQFRQVVNVCPGGLAFDINTGSCNWKEAVASCKN